MRKHHRTQFIIVFIVSTIAVGLLSAALGTDYWIVAKPIRLVDEATKGHARNVTGGDLNTKFQGYIHFGLFRGQKELDHGLGPRREHIKVTQQASNHELFNFGLWVSTIVFLVLAIVLGLTCMAFAALNAGTRPIETITGPMGLYLWNILAFIFCCTCFILYLILYFIDHRKNVLMVEDREVFKWTSEGRANLHFSFYLVVISAGLYAGNICLLAVSKVKFKTIKYQDNDKALEGVMMY